MKVDTDAGVDFYRKELAAEFARNQALEQQIERLLAELSKVKGELAALSAGASKAPPPDPPPVVVEAPPAKEPAAPKPAAPKPVEATAQKPAASKAVEAAAPKPAAPKPVEAAAPQSAPASERKEKKSKRTVGFAAAQSAVIEKVSLSRIEDGPSKEAAPAELLPDGEALLDGTRVLVPTSDLAHHSWTVLLHPQPAGTPCRLRFAAKAKKVERVTIRVRFVSEVQKTLRFAVDFAKGEMRQTGSKAEITPLSASMTPLEAGWFLFDIAFAPLRTESVAIVASFVDPEGGSRFDMAGKPGQSLLVGAASFSTGGGEAADAPTAEPPSRARESEPAGTEAAAAPEIAGAPGLLEMSLRDRTMTPTTMGGRPVSKSRWQKLALQRLEHEQSFTASGEYDKILAMKDMYKGKRAFILGNGPSINQQDLTLLRDEITFVANWFINHKRFRRINPKFYCVSSHEMFGGWGKEPVLNADFARLVAEKQTEQTFFFSYRFAEYMRQLGLVPPEKLRTLIFDKPKFVIDEIGTQNYDLNRCMDDGYTVLLTFCVPLCVHFGITDIYLLGCDCDYGLTAPTDPKAYFYRPEQHTSSTTSFDSLVRIWTPGGPIFQTYEIVAREAAARGTRMWNATRGGKLEVLPRVEYESLV